VLAERKKGKKNEAPDKYKEQYIEHLTHYHDIVSKGKLDLCWTDVVQHKMTTPYQAIQHHSGTQAANLMVVHWGCMYGRLHH
jgi:hypothetical protein